jgi:hypothetical protein
MHMKMFHICFLVLGALSLGQKWPEHEADYSPWSSSEVKSVWSFTSNPPYVFMACCLSTGTVLPFDH